MGNGKTECNRVFGLIPLLINLRNLNHKISELLKNMPVSISITSGKGRAVYASPTETEVKGLFFMGGHNIRKLPKAATTVKLPKHKDKQLVPIRQLPTQCQICNAGFNAVGYHTLKFTFWQKVNH